MGFFDRLNPFRTSEPEAPAVEQKAGWSVAFPNSALSTAFGTFTNNTGVAVTPSSSLQAAAVYSAVKVLSEDVAKLPVRVRRAQHAEGKTSWVDENRHPLNRLLRTPNGWQTPFEFWSYVVVSQQLWGNAYIAIKRDGKGNPRELIPLQPGRTQVLLNENGNLYYQTQHPFLGSDTKTLAAEDVIHIRNMSLDGGFLGMSPIACSQDVMGLALATQKHAAKLFQQGTILTGVLEHPGQISTEAGHRLKDSWDRAYAGSENAHKTAVLEEGMKFTPIGMNSQDAQLLESRKYSAEEIARIFRVPPHKIGLLDKATFSNIESQNQEYVADALLGICRRIEEACERDLFFDDERDDFQIRFDFSELLRGDTLTRMQGYHIGLHNGIYSRNEVRARENLAPIDGGDEYRVPLNTGDPGGLAVPNDVVPTGSPEAPRLRPEEAA